MKHALVFAAMAVWACGPIDQSGGTGAGGAPDGGAAADGGVGVDAGAGGGGAPDGGGGSAALDCTGVVPAELGSAVTVTTPHGAGDVCWNATGDLGGNVAAEAHPGSQGDAWAGTWQIWDATGSPRGTFAGVGGDVYGQQEGFQSTQGNSLVAWSATGQAVRRTPLDDKCAHEAFFSATGGTLVLERCGAKLTAYRFDAQGAQGASAEIGDASTAAGIIDFQDRTLIAISQAGVYAARWYDVNLKPAAGPFTLPGRGGSKPVVRPLLGGGAAIQIDGAWVATSQSGAGFGAACAGVARLARELRPAVHSAAARVRVDPADRRPGARHARSLLRRRRALRGAQVPRGRPLHGAGRDGDRKLRRRRLHARVLERAPALTRAPLTTPCTASPAPSAGPPCSGRPARNSGMFTTTPLMRYLPGECGSVTALQRAGSPGGRSRRPTARSRRRSAARA